MDNASITKRIIINGKLKLLSPLIIGSGENEFTDIDVVKDGDGKPYIPGTSLTGVLRNYFDKNFSDKIDNDVNLFWGYSKKIKKGKDDEHESFQSSFICNDLYSKDANINFRHGVKIEHKTCLAEDKGKFDYQITEKGAKFDLSWELILRKGHNSKKFEEIFATILDSLENGKISLGAKTTSGFGKCKLDDIKIYEFDYSNKQDVLKWLKEDFTNHKNKLMKDPYKLENKMFSINASFALKNSIIIRAYSEDPKMPDSTSIKSNGEYVLPGTSIKGSIRHRALKIIKSFDEINAETKINSLFGIAGENIEAIPGRVLVEEHVISGVEPEDQTRIQINRWTGGTIKGAMFDSMALWSKNSDTGSINLIININNYNPWEAGLMLHVLKDIWSEDLAFGGEKNVGRGILRGIEATITYADKEIKIKSNKNDLEISTDDIKKLNEFGDKFLEVVK